MFSTARILLSVGERFFLLLHVQTGSAGHPASHLMVTESALPRGKTLGARGSPLRSPIVMSLRMSRAIHARGASKSTLFLCSVAGDGLRVPPPLMPLLESLIP